jgi:23S rRNA pseudouridine2605 synthase
MGEGRKQQIREIGSLLGLPVVRIVRIRIGTLQLGNLKPAEWRHLTDGEVQELKGQKSNQPEFSLNRNQPRRLRRSPSKNRKP